MISDTPGWVGLVPGIVLCVSNEKNKVTDTNASLDGAWQDAPAHFDVICRRGGQNCNYLILGLRSAKPEAL